MDHHREPQAVPEERGKRELNDLDDGFIRVLEDLIDALLSNGILRLTDLPPQALEKLERRKATRQRMRDTHSLINDDEELI
ncbi:MAG: hypothetical protein RR749_18285 [Comamonas sp.]